MFFTKTHKIEVYKCLNNINNLNDRVTRLEARLEMLSIHLSELTDKVNKINKEPKTHRKVKRGDETVFISKKRRN